jgi:hypothetical protein
MPIKLNNNYDLSKRVIILTGSTDGINLTYTLPLQIIQSLIFYII